MKNKKKKKNGPWNKYKNLSDLEKNLILILISVFIFWIVTGIIKIILYSLGQGEIWYDFDNFLAQD